MNTPVLSRRDFLRASAAAGAAAITASALPGQSKLTDKSLPPQNAGVPVRTPGQPEASHAPGAQRMSVAALEQWEAMKFGMFIHFGLSTFTGTELPAGNEPSTLYAPNKLDVDQWVSVARDAGMKYAVLTTKHVSGHCLWPTRYNDYHVGSSGNKTDVVERFVAACQRRGVKPGFYYCSWDNHNRFDSLSPNVAPLPIGRSPAPSNRSSAYVTPRYLEFQWNQLTELMENYGAPCEWWIDIPHLLPRDYRQRLYDHIVARQPQAAILYNHGIGDGSELIVDRVWPTDLIPIERFLPNSATGHLRWRSVDGDFYYLPGEVCDPIGAHWFHREEDRPRSDAELLGMYLTSTSRSANLLLNVPPDKHGLIPDYHVAALSRLRKNIDLLNL